MTGRQRFEGRVCLVAGGGRGIGAETARGVVAEGGRVLIGDVDGDLAAQSASALGEAAAALEFDVTDPDACRQAVAVARSRFGRLDHLVTCAIRHSPGVLIDLSFEDWSAMLNVGLNGTFLMCQAAAVLLKEQGDGGSIVTLSSLAGIHPYDGVGAYSTVKAGVRMLSRQLAVELAPLRIRVNAVCPGHIRTPLTSYLDDPQTRRIRGEATPLGRVGEPVDVVGGILYLLSDDSAYVTGTELVIDGGLQNTVFPNLPGRTFG